MPKYRVPNDIQRIAQTAINENLERPKSQRAAMKEENGKIVFGTGMRTARRLTSGEIDEEQMILMRAWFSTWRKPKRKRSPKRPNNQGESCMAVMGREPRKKICNCKTQRNRTQKESVVIENWHIS